MGVYSDADLEDLGRDLIEWMLSDSSRFYLGDFCIEQCIPLSKLSRFAARSEVFAEYLQLAKDIQTSRLVHLGISGAGKMCVFALKNLSKWRSEPLPDEEKRIDGAEFVE